MNYSKFAPKIFTLVAVIGVPITTALAVSETPKAMRLIEEAQARTKREKVKAAWKCYIPSGASAIITIACILAEHSALTKQNAKLALAYGFGQTALRLYSERSTPQERHEIATVAAEANSTNGMILLDPENASGDEKIQWRDYISDQEFKASNNEIKWAINQFNETLLKVEGKGSLNQFYDLLKFTAIQPIGDLGERLGWRYSENCTEVIILRSPGFTKSGLPCMILDFVNPPQYGFNNEFA